MPLTRTIFRFDVSTLPSAAQMQSGTITINVTSFHPANTCVQKAPGAAWGNVSDHLIGQGIPAGPVALALGELTFTLTADQLAYIKSYAGGVCYFMIKDYDHDYLDTYAGTTQSHEGYAYTHAAALAADRPTLTLVYKA